MISIQLGNASYSHNRAPIRVLQNNSRITWDLVNRQEAFASNRPGVTRVFQHYNMCPVGATEPGCKTPQGSGMTNLTWIKSRFDKALFYHNQNPNNYHYGVYLLIEEIWHPRMEIEWSERKIKNWIIDGSLILPNNDLLELLKPWIIRTYGSWDQTWFDSIKSLNNFLDPKITAWSEYYGYTLLKAWHEFMRSLGKKSAMLGIAGFSGTNFKKDINLYFPGRMFNYLIQNYDFVTTGVHPKVMTDIDRDINWPRSMREFGYKGKIGHFIPSCWSDSWGCPWNKAVAEEDFKRVINYVDIILFTPFANTSQWTVTDANIYNPINTIYAPLAILWADTYLPIPCVPNWVCEIPLNGYESDGCGNRRLNSTCNKKYKCSGAPFYQCSEDPTGTYDTLAACNTACLTERPALSSIIVTPGTATIIVGESVTVVGTAIDSHGVTMGGIPIVWTSNPAGIVEINPVNTATFIDGKISTKIKGISPGMCIIKGTSGSVSGQLILDVNVAPPPPPSIKWKCSGSPDYMCTEDLLGTFNSQIECQTACKDRTKENEKVVLAAIAALTFLR